MNIANIYAGVSIIADFNTYFVSNLGIWVHNINKFCGSASDLANLARKSKKIDGLQGAKVPAELIHDSATDLPTWDEVAQASNCHLNWEYDNVQYETLEEAMERLNKDK